MTIAAELRDRIDRFLGDNPPSRMDRIAFLRARYDAGLAWVHYPVGLGGLGVDPAQTPLVDEAFAVADAPDNRPGNNVIGLGMAAPTLLRYATREQQAALLRPLWTGEDIWCQLFSEPSAGSDLAGLAATAVRDGDDWVVNGHKVWTTLAHEAAWALLVVRTDPEVPKHRGLTYFICRMDTPGIEVRPLRQLTGEAEFNEVYLTNVRVPDANRLGAVGDGWVVTQSTLLNERVAIGGKIAPRESGAIEPLVARWRDRVDLQAPELYDDLMRLWVNAETLRLSSARSAQQSEAGAPGPEGSGLKLAFARLAQEASSLLLDLDPVHGLEYDDWTMRRPDFTADPDRSDAYWYLRNRANSIEGGSSEIMRNIIADRVLRLPGEPRTDRDVPFKELPR